MLHIRMTGVAAGVAFLLALTVGAQPGEARTCSPVAGELVSVQGLVEYRDGAAWTVASPGESLCDRDAVRTGANSRAAIRLVDDAVLRLDENTTLVLSDVAPEPEEPSLLQLVFGAFQSFSRDPQTLQVDTPYINATIEGTEFALRVTDKEGTLVVVEGTVLASNDKGSVRVSSGNGAVASAGTAPQGIILARPRDAVNWGLFYPPTLALSSADAAGSPALADAVRLAGENRPDAAISALRAGSPTTRTRLYEAALLLSVGRADEAAGVLDAVLGAEPDNGSALAQRAVIDIVQNNTAEARGRAERAVAAAPGEAAPYIALSLAQQSQFQLEAARDTLLTATGVAPDSALVWARLSEIWLTLGYRNRSGEAADRALALDPDLARAHVLKGFAALTEYRTGPARESFERAIALDQADPMPRLGLGLALIREGELEAGRGEIDAAVALDSSRALLRAYLGKAYFEEDRNHLAVEQFEIAKELDPLDPTVYLYDAIRLQTENRPGEALAAIQQSIARNDNRAVYRSRLQLDQDQAARGASQGRIYEDLGFIQLGMREATGSQDLDPSNAAAHRFLADIYRNERRRELARVSELTRAQLLQDINLSPVQPSLTETNLNLVSAGGPANAGFNEFTSLFASDGFRFTSTGTIGNHDTFGGEAAMALQADNFSVSFGAFEFQSDGFRDNFDADHSIYNLFAQWAVTPEFNVQAEIRNRQTDLGDLSFNFDPDIFRPDLRTSLDETTARIGARFSPDPNNDTLFSFVYSDRFSTFANSFRQFGFDFESDVESDGSSWQGELQHIFQHDLFSLTVGGSYSEWDTDVDEVQIIPAFADRGFPPFLIQNEDNSIDAGRVYAYAYGAIPIPDSLGNLTLTLGASYDHYDEDVSIVASSPIQGIPPTTVTFNHELREFNPKVGLQWDLGDQLTVRAAYFEAVKPPLVANRTIEPTQVAGFNQYFDDPNATLSKRLGVGVDYKITDKIFVGGELTWRDLDSVFQNLNTRRFEGYDSDEDTHRAYAYLLPHPRVPVSVEFIYDRYRADSTLLTLTGGRPLDVETFSVPVTVRYFDPRGLFAGVRGTYVDQKVRRENPTFGQGKSTFFNLDAMIGYRLPNQRGSLTIEAQNLLDNDFEYQDDGFREFGNDPSTGPYFPEIGIMGRLTVNF